MWFPSPGLYVSMVIAHSRRGEKREQLTRSKYKLNYTNLPSFEPVLTKYIL